MANHNDVGKLGEQIAKKYLEMIDYTILETNWSWGKGEIDLIVMHQDKMVFVEVKTRKKNTFGYPEEAVNSKKQGLMYELATEYMYQNSYEGEIRFDIVAITLTPKEDIKHFKDAFFPTWD